MIIDNFLSKKEFSKLRKLCDSAKFTDTKSPYDDVVYPDLVVEIPDSIRTAVLNKLEFCCGEISDPIMFLRRSVEGVIAPHEVHSDTIMGDYSLFLYVNRPKHCQGGTALVCHKETGMYETPTDMNELEILERDQHETDRWETYSLMEMAPNRGAIMRAGLLHRAEPVGGFGTTNYDARIVLICFFKVNNQ